MILCSVSPESSVAAPVVVVNADAFAVVEVDEGLKTDLTKGSILTVGGAVMLPRR